MFPFSSLHVRFLTSVFLGIVIAIIARRHRHAIVLLLLRVYIRNVPVDTCISARVSREKWRGPCARTVRVCTLLEVRRLGASPRLSSETHQDPSGVPVLPLVYQGSRTIELTHKIILN